MKYQHTTLGEGEDSHEWIN